MEYFQKNTALGSEVLLTLVAANQQTADHLFAELWRRIYTFERQFSRFLPGSELSVFNRAAGTKQFVSPEFRDLLKASKEMSRLTGGLYNPFILPALQAAGYGPSMVKGHQDDDYDDHSAKSVAAADKLQIGDDWASIPYGTALDMGGCGKGYLGDKLANYIEDKVDGYWFSLGGDVMAGGNNQAGKNWKIYIQDANSPEKDIGWVDIPAGKRMAAATSGVIVHRGIHGKKPWHHLIDPRTLEPVETDILLATVCDSSCLRADVLASCVVITGSEKGRHFLEKHGVESGLLQTSDEYLGNIIFGELIRTPGKLDNKSPAKHNTKYKRND